ncbi:hypothetical protein SAMN04490355_104046 [Pelosinus propionicus DSM 13327]|uniref:Uncharacterized protein n=1 Tax=Pelosinus propionicus DSM 13327 TaxID=1123291 RepID=A0A1I4N2H6_9FIRM|nr:hypothetical protein SAMN04490355_104046 [Pelosinus propionicus DSM 13327]
MNVKNINCELCEKHTATMAIKNKHNGKVFRVCKCCADYVIGKQREAE